MIYEFLVFSVLISPYFLDNFLLNMNSGEIFFYYVASLFTLVMISFDGEWHFIFMQVCLSILAVISWAKGIVFRKFCGDLFITYVVRDDNDDLVLFGIETIGESSFTESYIQVVFFYLTMNWWDTRNIFPSTYICAKETRKKRQVGSLGKSTFYGILTTCVQSLEPM